MREIKFRAWHIGEAKMHTDIAVLACPNELFRVYDSYAQKEYIGNDKHCEIMQYTGLNDRNGAEIYEGDIIRKADYPFYSDGELNYLGVVEWEFAAWCYDMKVVSDRVRGAATGDMLDADGDGGTSWEVIGNIYENPELLEAKR